MKRLMFALLAALAVATFAADAQAGGWMFKPSNYSHSPYRGLPVGVDRFARGIYYSAPYGAYYRSGYRRLNGDIVVGGRVADHYHEYESWFQVGEQF